MRGEPGGFVLTPHYGENAEELYNFHVRPDDIWILSFPKSGTTWTQELVWLIANDCDFDGAKKSLNQRCPFLEFPYLPPRSTLDVAYSHLPPATAQMERLGSLESPRFLKTHLPFDLLPADLAETCKVVYVARNPKDVIVSYYYHHKLIKFHNFSGEMEEFAQYFMKDKVMYSPFFPHVLDAWNRRNHPNVLFLFYEDLKKDLRGGIERVGRFLGKTLSEDQLEKLTRHLTFENLSQNAAVNKEDGKMSGAFHENGNFMRKGETGDWKRHFSPELSRQISEWSEINLRGTDLSFVEEI